MKFKKSNDRYLLGVCGGIADAFNINHWIIRTLFIIVSILSLVLPVLIMYFILAAVMGKYEE